jgi:hypothetical protein
MTLFVVVMQLILLTPYVALAQANKTLPANAAPAANATPPATTTTPAAPAASATDHLFNPIKYTLLPDLIIGLTQIFSGAVIIVSVGFIVLGGVELVSSAGNQESIERGKKTITWAILGMVIALSAFSVVAIIEDILGVK